MDSLYVPIGSSTKMTKKGCPFGDNEAVCGEWCMLMPAPAPGQPAKCIFEIIADQLYILAMKVPGGQG